MFSWFSYTAGFDLIFDFLDNFFVFNTRRLNLTRAVILKVKEKLLKVRIEELFSRS